MGKLIIGNNTQVDSNVTDLVVINKEGEYTSSDEGKIFLGENVVITSEGALEANPSPSAIIVSSGGVTSAANKNYPCDATGGAFTLTLTTDLREYNVIKTDATANAVTIQPAAGTINGAASIPLNTQWQGKTVIYDGTNWIAF